MNTTKRTRSQHNDNVKRVARPRTRTKKKFLGRVLGPDGRTPNLTTSHITHSHLTTSHITHHSHLTTSHITHHSHLTTHISPHHTSHILHISPHHTSHITNHSHLTTLHSEEVLGPEVAEHRNHSHLTTSHIIHILQHHTSHIIHISHLTTSRLTTSLSEEVLGPGAMRSIRELPRKMNIEEVEEPETTKIHIQNPSTPAWATRKARELPRHLDLAPRPFTIP